MSRKSSIYLDYAAATPLDRKVYKAMKPYFAQEFFNPSATYAAAINVKKDLEEARAMAAYWLGVRSGDIIFTAGGSEANNLAIHGAMRAQPGSNIVISAIEHESVLAPASRYDCRIAKVGPDGRLDLDSLRSLIDGSTTLVSIIYANNEVGVIQPLREIAEIIKAISAERSIAKNPLPLLLHTDAAQAANYLDLHVSSLGVDMLSLNGGKIYGPKQSGLLYVSSSAAITPLIDGGGQERGLRSGTENVSGDIGLAQALQLVQRTRHKESSRVAELQKLFLQLIKTSIPGAVVNGSTKHRLPNNVHLSFPGADNERLLIQLDQLGIQAAAGSACTAGSELPSRVLKAMGISDDVALSSLRFTFGRYTTPADLHKAAKALGLSLAV